MSTHKAFKSSNTTNIKAIQFWMASRTTNTLEMKQDSTLNVSRRFRLKAEDTKFLDREK
jgi:hypothetical protein